MGDPLAAQDQVELREHERAEAFFDDAVLAFYGLKPWHDAYSRGAGNHHGPGFQGLQARYFDVGAIAAVFAHDVKDRQAKIPKSSQDLADDRNGGMGPGYLAGPAGHGEVVLHVDDQ